MSDGIRRVSVELGGGWEYFDEETFYCQPLSRDYHNMPDDQRMEVIENCRRNMKIQAEIIRKQSSLPVRPVPPGSRWEGGMPDIGSIAREKNTMFDESGEKIRRDTYEFMRRRFEERKNKMSQKLQLPSELRDYLYYNVGCGDYYHEECRGVDYGPNPITFHRADRIPGLMDLDCVTNIGFVTLRFTTDCVDQIHEKVTDVKTFDRRTQCFVQMKIELDDGRILDITLVIRRLYFDMGDLHNLQNMHNSLQRARMEKYIHRCKKKVLPHYDPKKSYTKLTEEEMP